MGMHPDEWRAPIARRRWGRGRRLVAFALVLGLLGGEVAALSAPINQRPWAARVPAGQEAVTLVDTFDDPIRGLVEVEAPDPPNLADAYRDGEFVMSASVNFGTAYTTVRGTHADTVLAIDARLVGDATGRYLAFGCRNHSGLGRGYELRVEPADARYILVRTAYDTGGAAFPLHEGALPAALASPNDPLRLEMGCVGGTISVRVDGVEVATVEDDLFAEGRLFVGVGTLGSQALSPVEGRFDNLELTILPAEPPAGDEADPAAVSHPPDAVADPPAVRLAGPVVVDDFADATASVLAQQATDPTSVRIGHEAGEYVIAAVDRRFTGEVYASLPRSYPDVAISVDARLVGEVPGQFLGLGCRRDAARSRGYRFVVSLDPYYPLFWLDRYDGAQAAELAAGSASEAVVPGNATNYLELTCVGSTISARANGIELASVEDDRFQDGAPSIGAGVGICCPGILDVRFDNLTVRDLTGLGPPAPVIEVTDDEARRVIAEARRQVESAPRRNGIDGGRLRHVQGQAGFHAAGVEVGDFLARVRFTNPYDVAIQQWDYGILFRDDGTGTFYWLIVGSGGQWSLWLESVMLAAGVVPNLDTDDGGTNELVLVVIGGTAFFELNGDYVAALDVSDHEAPGDVVLATAAFTSANYPGAQTPFADFGVWDLGPSAPAATPTAVAGTPTAPTPVLHAPSTSATAPPGLARAKARAKEGSPVFTMASGRLVEPADTVALRLGRILVRDFHAVARFTNPGDPAAHPWDYGFFFRHAAFNEHYRLIVTSAGEWLARDGPDDTIASGALPVFDGTADGANEIALTVVGNVGHLEVNGVYLGAFDISSRPEAGDVGVFTASLRQSTLEGRVTSFSDFTVWSLDEE